MTTNQVEDKEVVDREVVTQAEPKAPAAPAKKVYRKAQPTGRNGRVACAGGCGTKVLRALGECRKCRKARLRTGLKHILKMKKVPA